VPVLTPEEKAAKERQQEFVRLQLKEKEEKEAERQVSVFPLCATLFNGVSLCMFLMYKILLASRDSLTIIWSTALSLSLSLIPFLLLAHQKELSRMTPEQREALEAETAAAEAHDASKTKHFARLGRLAGGGAKSQVMGGGGRGGRGGRGAKK
jgi:hypothetical protein